MSIIPLAFGFYIHILPPGNCISPKEKEKEERNQIKNKKYHIHLIPSVLNFSHWLPTMWSISFLLYAAAAALGTYYITSTFYQWYRLRHVPGPFLAGFSYLWLLFVAPSGREPYVYWDLANKHGHLVRTGPNVVITDDPEVLRRTGATRGSSGRYGKDGFYLAVLQHPDHKNMFATMDVAAHDEKKAKLLGAYSGRETDAMEPLVDGFVDELVRYLRRKISHSVNAETCRSASVTVELGRTVQYFTLDVITRVAFGKELGYLQTDSDVHNLVEMVTATATAFTIIISIPWIRSIATSDIFKKYFGPKSTDPTGLGVIIRQVIRSTIIVLLYRTEI